jgi:excisionase family DNA binding protein
VDLTHNLDPEGVRTIVRALGAIERAHADLARAHAEIRTALEPHAAAEPEPAPDLREFFGGEPWLSKAQAAQYLGTSTRWVEMRSADSGLPFIRLGGVNRYRASELDEWAARREPVAGDQSSAS